MTQILACLAWGCRRVYGPDKGVRDLAREGLGVTLYLLDPKLRNSTPISLGL